MRHATGTWAVAVALLGAASAGCAAGDGAVKVYEGHKEILTGPFRLKAPAPQKRLAEFKRVRYPAVYIENEYFRCCVLPTVGGRLYEVYNKASKSQVFFVNPFLETHENDFAGGHPWNLGGVEVNFPYFHHGNTYNDRWQWAPIRRADGSAGVMVSFTSRPTMQRTGFRILLRPGVARVDLEYRFENLNPYSWGLAAWIDTMHFKTNDIEFILPTPWVAGHGHNRSRTRLEPWPVRKGVDLSWQKNVPKGGDLSEFGFMPRHRFHGCYDHGKDRGAARVFDPRTLPAAKLWTQALPASPELYYQHFEIWTATSAVMEDPKRQGELSCTTGADSWQQVWGIGGYVFANRDLALNLARRKGGKLLAGVCGTRRIADCVVSLRQGHETICRQPLDLDPARPWRKELADPNGDVTMEVTAPDGRSLACYELRTDEQPKEQWEMPAKPRWASGRNAAYYDEDYSTLWRRRGHFLDGAIGRYRALLKADPNSPKLLTDLARAHLKDAQVRRGFAYQQPGPKADADAAKRRTADLATAVSLLGKVLEKQPKNARGHLYLALALEGQGKRAEAIRAYRSAVSCRPTDWAAALELARLLLKDKPAEALALSRQAVRAYPQCVRAKHVLMVALTRNGKGAEAANIGKRLRELDPADPLTTHLLAAALARDGKAEEARALSDETNRLLAGDETAKAGLQADLRRLAAP